MRSKAACWKFPSSSRPSQRYKRFAAVLYVVIIIIIIIIIIVIIIIITVIIIIAVIITIITILIGPSSSSFPPEPFRIDEVCSPFLQHLFHLQT